MKRKGHRRLIILALTLGMLLAFSLPALGTPGDEIRVTGADVVQHKSMDVNQGLLTITANVIARHIVQYGAEIRFSELIGPPNSLMLRLQQLLPRMVSEYSQVIRYLTVSPPPNDLVTRLDQASPRIVVQYAAVIRSLGVGTEPGATPTATPTPVVSIQHVWMPLLRLGVQPGKQ